MEGEAYSPSEKRPDRPEIAAAARNPDGDEQKIDDPEHRPVNREAALGFEPPDRRLAPRALVGHADLPKRPRPPPTRHERTFGHATPSGRNKTVRRMIAADAVHRASTTTPVSRRAMDRVWR